MVSKNTSGNFFSTKELTLCALFGALIFALCFVLGTGIITLTGIAVAGGVANVTVTLIALAIGMKLIDRFGIASIILAVTGALSISTVNFGPPGLYKIPMLFAIGLLADMTVHIFKKKDDGYLLAGAVSGFTTPLAMFYFMSALSLPGVNKLAPVVNMFALAYAVLGAIGMKIGLWLFENKLKNRAFVKHMRS